MIDTDNGNRLQQSLFQTIKTKLPDNISFSEEIANVLNISLDSVYRRIRGQKLLTFTEIEILCKAYRVSLDTLFLNSSDLVSFHYRPYHYKNFAFKEYLHSVKEVLKNASENPETVIYFEAKDLPLPNLLYFPEIAAFKIFFWSKVIYREDDYSDSLFSLDEVDPEMFKLSNDINKLLLNIKTVEIWNEDTINSTVRQISYCYQAGFFRSEKEFEKLIEKMCEFVDHFKKQAQFGFRFKSGLDPRGRTDSFKLYFTEVFLPNNNIIIQKGEKVTSYVSQNDLSILVTRNPEFCKHSIDWLKKIIQSSTYITSTSEKERNIFFRRLNKKIESLYEKV